jgi:8-oxo-dGTP pyrophosphatase MutT (NUDIX family)
MPIVRHFTATAFVVHESKILLHWHPKVQAWLPPGGHIDDNEDPVQAVLREVTEETGIRSQVVSTGPVLDLDYPVQVTPPFTIMVEDIRDPVDGYHQHIDMIYFCRLAGPPTLSGGWQWVSRSKLESAAPLVGQDGAETVPPKDVRVLGLLSLDSVSSR